MLRPAAPALMLASALAGPLLPRFADAADYDVLIRHGTIYDGSGARAYAGDIGIRGDRIVYVGPEAPGKGREVVEAKGKAVAPGFINMLAHPEESLLVDGRALSDLRQGVTLEIMGEDSMGPLTPSMKANMVRHQGDIRFDVDWTTLGEYLDKLEHRGIAPNVASFVGAGTVRINVLGENDVTPDRAQLDQMRALVHQAMEQGALGVTTALIYNPNTYARTPELIELAQESALCGGMYIAHIRSEGDRVMEAVQETIEIAKSSGAPAEIYHLKLAGQPNWNKLDPVILAVESARASGVRITADMYTYTAGQTGLDAAMPPWVQEGGIDRWIERLKDPEVRVRVAREMTDATPSWENLMLRAGPAGTLLLGFQNPKLKPLTGRTLADVAKERGVTPQEVAMQLVVEDGSRVGVAYFLMSEDNVRREVALPWVSFGSDASAPAPEGVFLLSNEHPRAYGNFVRVIGKYVRDEKALTLEQAVRKLSGLPASNLSLTERGLLKPGFFADVVVFDPKSVRDHATYDKPHRLATGVEEVWINGIRALRDSQATGAASGRVVHGRAWTGGGGAGCRAQRGQWTWNH